ncbi:hypothetical protein AK812_SmicGene27912 [Symbiodinium microadriaticum]|uniref:Uncharacterized protein n=1 Tax=Symbiodinium microadriaticum TaxID=2951 RepID=A0A1Q9D5V6_SYMMI|nr:hypothetical protein AK812_SmicGene27912 [Symbiodinium microadriaticum]
MGKTGEDKGASRANAERVPDFRQLTSEQKLAPVAGPRRPQSKLRKRPRRLHLLNYNGDYRLPIVSIVVPFGGTTMETIGPLITILILPRDPSTDPFAAASNAAAAVSAATTTAATPNEGQFFVVQGQVAVVQGQVFVVQGQFFVVQGDLDDPRDRICLCFRPLRCFEHELSFHGANCGIRHRPKASRGFSTGTARGEAAYRAFADSGVDLASIPVAAFQPTAVAAIDGVVQAARAAASAMVGAVKAPATMGLKGSLSELKISEELRVEMLTKINLTEGQRGDSFSAEQAVRAEQTGVPSLGSQDAEGPSEAEAEAIGTCEALEAKARSFAMVLERVHLTDVFVATSLCHGVDLADLAKSTYSFQRVSIFFVVPIVSIVVPFLGTRKVHLKPRRRRSAPAKPVVREQPPVQTLQGHADRHQALEAKARSFAMVLERVHLTDVFVATSAP